MIIFSQIRLEIGKIYGPETHTNFKLHVEGQSHEEFRFMVMRESNKKEYLEYYKGKYGQYPKNEPFYSNFYLISPD